MDKIDIVFSFVWLGCAILNFLHWRFHPQTRWHYEPSKGSLRLVFNCLIVVIPIAAVLSLQQMIQSEVFVMFMATVMIWYQLHSIGVRRGLKP